MILPLKFPKLILKKNLPTQVKYVDNEQWLSWEIRMKIAIGTGIGLCSLISFPF